MTGGGGPLTGGGATVTGGGWCMTGGGGAAFGGGGATYIVGGGTLTLEVLIIVLILVYKYVSKLDIVVGLKPVCVPTDPNILGLLNIFHNWVPSFVSNCKYWILQNSLLLFIYKIFFIFRLSIKEKSW